MTNTTQRDTAAGIVQSTLTRDDGMEHRVGDRTANDVFGATPLARLATAACRGDEQGIAAALRDGADVNGQGHDGVTPLLWALGCDNARGIEALLKAGANPNQDVGAGTAVYLAATRHDHRVLRVLLQHGGDANAFDANTGMTALQEAFSLGLHGFGWDNYDALLAKADLNRADEHGWTIATEAAAMGRFDKVVELLERGYARDLSGLGRIVQRRVVTSDDDKAWQVKAKELLEARR
jgi:ankyrin repeat protein